MSEFIYSFKEFHKQNETNEYILEKFALINKLILSSTQFQDTKKKLLNTVYSAKWKIEKCDLNNAVNIAYQSMNKLCETNFDDVYNKISKLIFLNVSDLEKITFKLITKIITEKLFIEIYIKMIYKLLINYNWIVQNVSFRQMLIANIKTLYNKDNNIGLFYLIGYLFKYKIFSFSLITNILDDNIVKSKEIKEIKEKIENIEKIEEDIEKLLVLWSIVNNNIKEYNINSYNKYYKIITELYPYMSKRLQYMSIDSYNIIDININNNNDNDININTNNNINNNNIDIFYNYIIYIDEFENIKSLLDEVKKLYNDNLDLFLKCVLKYTIDEPKEINKIVNIIKEGLQYKFWTKKILHNLIQNIESTEINDILIDAPYYKKHLEIFKL
jgi:hypothetical protein